MTDYCNTPAQLSPSVFYDTAHEQQLEASRADKKIDSFLTRKLLQNLLKKMKANFKKYLKMVQDVQVMNNLVSEAKTKCFWDPEVMEACKEWDQTLQNNPICVPPDSVQKHETAASPVHQEPENPASEVHHEVTTNEEGREDEEAQKVISTVLVQMASEGILQPDDGGVTDTLIANIQTVEPGVYAYQTTAKETGENETVIEETVNLAESTQNIQQKVQEKVPEKDPQQPDTEVEVEKEKEVECPQVTAEELHSVELVLSLGPSLEEDKEKKQTKGRKTSKPKQVPKQVMPKGLNELLYKTIEQAKIRAETRCAELGDKFCSPYCNRVVNMHEALLNQELNVIRYTFAIFAGLQEEFYRSKTEVATFKAVFESFYREQYIASNGIDAFVDILNLEEKKRDRKSSPYRLFLSSTMMPDIFYDEEKYIDNQRLKIFASNFEDMLLRYEVKKLDSIDLVFIPVLQGDHFYVLCFNLKSEKIEPAAEQDFKDRYKGLPDTLLLTQCCYVTKKGIGFIPRRGFKTNTGYKRTWKLSYRKKRNGLEDEE
ncbi:uncharacterized protein LOC110893207 [Helianthus annuus]|uniref:uncharacterized protein LOC110893207 n=1 Tax=Helianthus annuus TaxID=4232 RepID=UPI001653283E|nr:uncharacterized protein LOC110893207 [Helianthus annuus]